MSKTIEIDEAAYLCLEQVRRPNEDWSALIRRCVCSVSWWVNGNGRAK